MAPRCLPKWLRTRACQKVHLYPSEFNKCRVPLPVALASLSACCPQCPCPPVRHISTQSESEKILSSVLAQVLEHQVPTCKAAPPGDCLCLTGHHPYSLPPPKGPFSFTAVTWVRSSFFLVVNSGGDRAEVQLPKARLCCSSWPSSYPPTSNFGVPGKTSMTETHSGWKRG